MRLKLNVLSTISGGKETLFLNFCVELASPSIMRVVKKILDETVHYNIMLAYTIVCIFTQYVSLLTFRREKAFKMRTN